MGGAVWAAHKIWACPTVALSFIIGLVTIREETAANSRGVETFYQQLIQHARQRIPCRTMDSELWFTSDFARQREAASHCAVCPIRSECRAAGRLLQATHGVWGGENPRERRRAGYIGRA